MPTLNARLFLAPTSQRQPLREYACMPHPFVAIVLRPSARTTASDLLSNSSRLNATDRLRSEPQRGFCSHPPASSCTRWTASCASSYAAMHEPRRCYCTRSSMPLHELGCRGSGYCQSITVRTSPGPLVAPPVSSAGSRRIPTATRRMFSSGICLTELKRSDLHDRDPRSGSHAPPRPVPRRFPPAAGRRCASEHLWPHGLPCALRR